MSRIRETVRSDLRNIVKGGATSRILDLHSIARRYGEYDAHADNPFFLHGRLNRCFIVKHTVRAHERPYVMSNQPVVTKVLVPLAHDDLALGGHAVFVEEIGFAGKMRTLFERKDEPHLLDLDLIRLRELAALPSFDPFLLAERFRDHVRPIDDCYFNITDAEVERMEQSVAKQIVSVVALAFGEEDGGRDDERAMRFTRQLLSGDLDGRMQALRKSLDMTEIEFKSGIFGWKGVLYYRWCMSEALSALKSFITQLKAVSIVGASDHEYNELQHMRRSIIEETRHRWKNLTSVMDEYEHVFGRFCRGEDVNGFRNFLLKAPTLFYDVGSDLSAVSHVPGYWSYWAKQNSKGFLQAREAMMLFSDFIASVTRFSPGSATRIDDARRRMRSPIPHPVVQAIGVA
ncbi:hypothetical protein AWH62_12305 [Maricaulis sp. W15]|uniref:hypothetical protein n=1 Tax=Maricaulis sp. W15 TaxID=1772333 RepID=UPI000948EAC9|nr:hypothetical protein [Maricaulis sp. W15]OLF71328.1 hypothetical protein AWH62_12305 [Maricaulis sp. W15]